MGWFDEQIKQRIKEDEADFSQAVSELSGVVMGKEALRFEGFSDSRKTLDALHDILRYYHVKAQEIPSEIEDINDQLEYLLRPSGIMRRVVKLTPGWYKDAVGAMLGRTRGGDPVALLPYAGGYRFFHHESNEFVRLSKNTEALLAEEAICFYRPLPLRALKVKDLMQFVLSSVSTGDIVMFAAATLVVTLMGLFSPYLNDLIFSQVVPSGRMSLLLPVACLFFGITLSSTLVGIVKSLLMTGIQIKMNGSIQAAAMMRVLSLPTTFFKQYSAGELSTRVQSFASLCSMFTNVIFNTGFSFLFSLMYLGQIRHYAEELAIPALIIVGATLVISVISTLMQVKRSRERIRLTARQNGIVFSLFTGIPKIKLAGAERRAFTQWARAYKELAQASYDLPLIVKINAAIITGVSLLGTIFLYYAAAGRVQVAEYMAFNTVYGLLAASFASLGSMTATVANFEPTLKMVEPILKEEPEIDANKKTVSRISGNVEVSHVSFRYTPETPLILDDFTLNVRAGQYLAIVGKTGCGKSTLMRLLLGFETPQKGTVYYDGRDIADMDLRSLRRNIGVVMQNGKLFQGDIFSNITISAPWLSLDDAWRAAEMAGMAEDIRNMPMGMHTIISEGSGGISGGQKQRLMIARAIAPSPKLLMFDEATSALDNITQKIVSESLDALKCTRIVIAHRLSTVRHCDRIVVIDGGKIVEDGNYDSLIAKNGFFAELVARQRLDKEETDQ